MDESLKTLRFDAVLHPHRSLSKRGFLILMSILCGISFAAGMTFVLMGAWPVFGFFGLDVLGLYWAFRLNYRSGAVVETIQLTEEALIVGRLHPDGHFDQWRFQPYWVRIVIGGEHPDDNRITLASHGKSVVIGSFLSAEERGELATALQAALARYRAELRPVTADQRP